MSRSRLAAAVAIPVLLAIGLALVLLYGRHPTGIAEPATVVPPTVTPPSTINPPEATGDDWLAIMGDILTYRHYLYEHPQPNLLDQIYDRRCPCYAQERSTLADLERRGWRYNDKGVQVLKAKLLGSAAGDPSIVAVEVISRGFPQLLVDRGGKILERKPGSGMVKTPYQLLRGTDGRWRVSLVGVSQPED